MLPVIGTPSLPVRLREQESRRADGSRKAGADDRLLRVAARSIVSVVVRHRVLRRVAEAKRNSKP